MQVNAVFECDLLTSEQNDGVLQAIITLAMSDIHCSCDGASAMVYFRWQLEIDHQKGYEILRLMVKTVWKSDQDWLCNQSKIFSMLKLLLQVITSNSNVQSGVDRKQITCNVCAGLKYENCGPTA